MVGGFCLLLSVFFASPIVIGFVDMWCWFMIGHTMTGINYGEDNGARGFMATMFGFLAFGAFGLGVSFIV